MPLIAKRQIIGIKTETTEGTAIAMTATDYLLAENVQYKPNYEVIKREVRRSSFDSVASVVGQRSVEISFRAEVKGSGTAGTAYAPLGAALKACAFNETVAPGTSVTYALLSAKVTGFSSPARTATIEVYQDGLKKQAVGCVGNVKKTIEAGKIAYFEFTFRGKYVEPTDVALPTPTYLATKPPIVQSANFTVDSYAAIVSKVEIDLNNEIQAREDINSAFGIKGFVVIGREPKGTIDPEADLIATYNWYSKLTSGAEGQLSVQIGATAGNICTITCPKAQYNGVDDAERNGNLALNIPLQFNQNTGDDAVSIVFT